ncbi:vascular cell adhesion protein 1 isoform X2 [Myotis myotis]|uniref:Vascular cell adhesion protein 1 n=1 Tax=Myotis myotis TaxID=51298 RepID=A0A7J7SUE2_MYOMY|nr:vascular cell adhesion protein 1 isoform X2 [Myotis myotis]KAF6292000.1 vascular cell adhesion molecule 1 [Myotis myotis]
MEGISGALALLWMVFAASQAFKIEISPGSPVMAQIGASVSLTCRASGCEAPAFSWRTQIDSPLNGKVRSAGSTSTLTMDPVSFENEHSYLCTATCGVRKAERSIEVQVYSFPKDPEIHLPGPLQVGQPVTVTCLVPDVYPFDRLEIDLLKDNRLLKNQEFLEPMEGKSLKNMSLEVTFTPTREDMGKALLCRATLHITGVDAELRERETTKELQVYVSPKDTTVSVSPSTRLQEGGSVTMTCASEGLPAPQIVWSRKLDNGNLQPLSGNATLTLIAMRMEDSGIYVCAGVNLAGEDRKEVELLVQEKPFTVEIGPGPQVAAQLGGAVVLTCGATDCEAPSFSWRTQTDSPLSGQVRSEGPRSTLTLSPVGFENEHLYLCTVTCGSKKLEKGIKVDLYSFRRDPEIEMSGVLVSGSPVTVSCKVPEVYPLERLEIQLLKGGRVVKNKNFLMGADKKSLETGSLDVTFVPTTEDTGEALVCLAQLHMDELDLEPTQRQSSHTLYVNNKFAPRNTSIQVSPSSILEEGSSVTMTCSSDGLPAPRFRWSRQLKNGQLQFLSENTTLTLTSTRREDAGIYVCEGRNLAGISRDEVELIIQVAPKDMQLTASPSESVKEGDTVIISCTCGNVPKTWIILKKKAESGDTVLKSIEGAYTIHKAQLEDAGVYECESKNERGLQSRSITLDVKGREGNKDYFSPGLLVLYCASSLIIPAIGMIVYFARKANMKGSYSLVEAQKSKV